MKRVRPYALLGGVAGLIRYVSDAVVRVAPITIAAVLPIVLAIATQAGAQHSDMASSAPPPPAVVAEFSAGRTKTMYTVSNYQVNNSLNQNSFDGRYY